tara:strand:- start:10 stop:2937 length:2928 start_codon:yes stop_codon:yes gene_type:complete
VRTCIALVIILLFAPLANAAPPPGDSEVSNEICSSWANGNGICDDYSSSLDSTLIDEWIEGHVAISMEGASAIEMSIELAVHELSREELGLLDLDLQGDSDPSDGIPADFIRNYRDYSQNGLSVEDRLIQKIEDVIQQIVDENFPNATSGPIQTISEINFFGREPSSCTFNPNIDSIDEENGLENDPFNPPICVHSALTLDVIPTNIGMNSETGDIDRVMQGLIAMGGEVTTNFTTIAPSGHYIEYVMVPPSYSSIIHVDEPASVFSVEQGQTQILGARIALDNLNSPHDYSPIISDLVAVLGSGDITPDWEINAGSSLSLDLSINLENPLDSHVDMEIGIHHLSTETLEDWGLDLETQTISLDSVTSDGIRMFDSEMDVDADQMLSSLPIDLLSETFSQFLGAEIVFQTPSFSTSNNTGGIMFQHRQVETCGEELSYRYCLGPVGTMSSTYPITVQSTTISSEIQISNIFDQLLQNTDGDLSTIDFSQISDEDIATIMSFLSLEFEVDSDFFQDLIPIDFPSTDISVTIHLPEWLDSSGKTPDVLVFTSNHGDTKTKSIEIEGSRPFDWRHSICRISDPCEEDSIDLVCAPTQKTCISFLVEMDVSKVSVHELSGSVSIEFTSTIILEIYRLGLDMEIEGVKMSPIPSDAIRRILVMGDRMEGGLLADSEIESTIDFGVGDPVDFEVSNEGLMKLSDYLTESYEEMMNEFGSINLGSQDFALSADFSSLPFQADFGEVSLGDDPFIGDEEPIRLATRIDDAELTFSLRQDEIIVGANPRSLAMMPTMAITSILPSPLLTESGLLLDGSNIRQRVTPLMEHTNFGTIKSSAFIEILLPESIRITSLESEKGLAEISDSGDRQLLTYIMPTCLSAVTWYECSSSNSDIVTFSVELSWTFIIGELAPYIFFIIISLGILVSRKRRKNIEKKQAQIISSNEEKSAEMEKIMEIEFGRLPEKTTLVDETFFDQTDSEDP